MPHTIVRTTCTGVGDCLQVCPTAAIERVEPAAPGGRWLARIRPERCIDCGACRMVCPVAGAVLPDWQPDLQGMAAGIPCLECGCRVEDAARFCLACSAPVAARTCLEDLQLLDAPGLALFVAQVGTRLLAAVLRAAGEPLAGHVARRLGAREAEALRGAAAALGPVARGDLDDARERALNALRRLVATRRVRYRAPD